MGSRLCAIALLASLSLAEAQEKAFDWKLVRLYAPRATIPMGGGARIMDFARGRV